jgi:ADP-heptose:LPS heptosyltransferase
MSSLPPVLVSRCDRLGDLVLSLPTLAFLAAAGFRRRILHCSAYAADLGLWARHNGLCEGLWVAGQAAPAEVLPGSLGLSLFHHPLSLEAFAQAEVLRSYGPRSKLSSLWSYTSSLRQARSRVAKSEMEYNLDLARFLMLKEGIRVPEFHGLPALALPPDWRSPVDSPALAIVLANGGSARNWPVAEYVARADAALAIGQSVHFLVQGVDALARRAELQASGVLERGAIEVGAFAELRELIAYLAGAQHVLASSTGPLHLAHAAGVPVTGIYPREPRVQRFDRWRPHGYWHGAPVRLIEI